MAYIGPEPNPGQNREVDDISSGFNGSEVNFTLQVNNQNVSPGSPNNIIVSLGGVVQNPSTDYNIAASTITFTTAPANGLSFFGLVLGQQVDIQSLADGASPTMSAPTITGDLSIADKIVHTGDTNTAIRFSAADTVSVETAGTTKASISSVGKLTLTSTETSNSNPVVLNASGQAYFQVITPNNTIGGIKFGDVDDDDVGAIKYGHGDNRMQFDVNGSERIRILSGGGITFNGDTSTANALDDYEEGTWTPTSNIGAITVYSAHYVKVGKAVTVQAYIEFPSMSGSSGVNIGSFPFSTGSGDDRYSCAVSSNANFGGFQVLGQLSVTTLDLRGPDGTNVFSVNAMSQKIIAFSIAYTVV